MENIFRTAIVGCGKIASEFADDPKMMGDIFTHAEAYSACEDTVLTTICDTDPEKLKTCGDRWQVPSRYSHVSEMFRNESIDIVSVSTPDTTHFEVIQEILSAPGPLKAILCEKPLATNLEEAEEIIRLAQEAGVILSVMYMRRHAENYQALKKFISSGRLGDIQAISGWYTKGIFHNGTHWLDVLRWLSEEVGWVMAWNNLAENLEDPTLDIVLGMENGVLASLRACDSKSFTIFEMDILGTLGRVRVLDSGFQMEHSRVVESTRYSGYKELGSSPIRFGDRKNLMLHAVQDVISALKNGTPMKCTGEDGLKVLRIAQAAIEAAKTGEMVQIN